MAKTAAAAFQCAECGWRTTKWSGRCGECQSWGSMEPAAAPRPLRPGPRLRGGAGGGGPAVPAISIASVDATAAGARPTGVDELDRVLGGGLVPGAVVLLAGEPGVGKSTLLLEVGATFAAAAGPGAVRHRRGVGRPGAAARRPHRRARTTSSTSRPRPTSARCSGTSAAVEPQLLIVDSVQTITADGVDGAAGGVTQIREVTRGADRRWPSSGS